MCERVSYPLFQGWEWETIHKKHTKYNVKNYGRLISKKNNVFSGVWTLLPLCFGQTKHKHKQKAADFFLVWIAFHVSRLNMWLAVSVNGVYKDRRRRRRCRSFWTLCGGVRAVVFLYLFSHFDDFVFILYFWYCYLFFLIRLF